MNPPNKNLLDLGKRMSGHFFWYLIGFFIRMGLPQLLFFPLCMHLLGEDKFGKFIYAYGLVGMVGLAPTKGLVDTFLRNVASISERRRDLFLSTILILAAFIVSGLLLLTGAALILAVGFNADRQLLIWIALVVVAFAAQNMAGIQIAKFSFERKYAVRAIWQSIQGVAAFVAIPIILLIGAWGLPIGFAIGHTAAYVLLLIVYYHPFHKTKELFDRKMAKRVMTTWLILTSSGIFFLSSRYIHRSILGIWSDYQSVSIFFAAAAALEIFVVPIDIIGMFGFSILSAHSSSNIFSKRFCGLYASAVGVAALLLYALMTVLAKYLVKLMYPSVSLAAQELIPIMGVGVSMMVLAHLTRPFVMKFASSKTMLTISIISFAAHAGAAFSLIPRWHIRGAAYAYCIGCGVVGLTWLCFFLDRFLFRRKLYLISSSVDKIDAGAIEDSLED